MKQIIFILGLLVLIANAQDLQAPQPNPLPPPYPPMTDGQLEVPWNNYGIDQLSLIQHMQEFPQHYATSDLKVLIFDLRQNYITNIVALNILAQYTNIQELTIDIGSQNVDLQAIGDMSFVKSLTSLRKFDFRASNNKLNTTYGINQFSNPTIITRLSIDLSYNLLTSISEFQFLTIFTNVLYLTIKVDDNLLSDITILDNIKVLANIYQLIIYSYNNQAAQAIDLTFLQDFNSIMNLKYFYGAESRSCALYGHYIDASSQYDWSCNSCYQPCSRCFGSEFTQCLQCANTNVYYLDSRDHQCIQILPNVTSDGKLQFKYEKAGFTDLEMRNLMYNFAQKYTDYTQIKYLYLYLNDNNITSAGVDELQQITYYKYIIYLEMWLNDQVPSLGDIGPLVLVKQMPLQTFIIRLSDNAITNVDFIKPLYRYCNNTLTRLEIYLDGNSITDFTMLQSIGSLYQLSTFVLRLEGSLTDLTPLAYLRNCSNLTSISLSFTQSDATVKTDYTFVNQYNWISSLQYLKTKESKLIQCDMRTSGKYIAVSADKNSWSCQSCYKYCSKCFGPASNQCITCSDSQKLIYNPVTFTCDFKMPDIDQYGTLSINFNSFQITDSDFATILSLFQRTYTTSSIKNLIFDIRANNITSFSGLSMLDQYVSIQTMELSLLDQVLLTKVNYSIISDFSQKLSNMNNFILDMRECDTTQNFINVFDYGNQWKCQPCVGQCQKCFGTDTNQCNSCIDSPILHYNPTTHICEFVLPPVTNDYLMIDLSNIRLQDPQLATIMSQFTSQYKVGDFHHLDFLALCNPSLTNFSSLQQISNIYVDLLQVEFQLRQYSAPNMQDITFVQGFNYLENLTMIEMNWNQCPVYSYISVVTTGSPLIYQSKCLACFPTCTRCFGSQENQCTGCRSSCKLHTDTHTCQC